MDIENLLTQCEKDCAEQFAQIDARALRGTRRVLDAFAAHQVAAWLPPAAISWAAIGP